MYKLLLKAIEKVSGVAKGGTCPLPPGRGLTPLLPPPLVSIAKISKNNQIFYAVFGLYSKLWRSENSRHIL